jgi:hypothetical protein
VSISFDQTAFAQVLLGPSPGTTASYTPSASGEAAIVWAFTHGGSSITWTITGTGATYNQLGQYGSGTAGDIVTAYATSISGASQTTTFNDNIANFDVVWGVLYAGVGSVGSWYSTDNPSPGTGTGAVVGHSVTVPSGSWLLAFCLDATGGVDIITNTSGTSRSSSASNQPYNITDYAGSGAAIQPAFTASVGTDEFVVQQVILTPPVGGASLPLQINLGLSLSRMGGNTH